MSLVALAARLILVEALKGKTWAGDGVLNAPLEPVADLLDADGSKPMITVYTGMQKSKPVGRDLVSGEVGHTLEIVTQVYIPPGDAEGEDVSGINVQRGGAALAIDIVWRQIVAAIQVDLGDWATLWRKLIVSYEDFDSRPVLLEVENGMRVPCREVSLVCRTLPEPAFGVALNPFWSALDVKLREGSTEEEPTEHSRVADMISALITKPDDMPEWHKTMALMGWSRGAVEAMGLVPMAVEDGEDPVMLTDFTIDPATVFMTGNDPDA